MPKIISRSIIVTDKNSNEQTEDLHSYYCLCGSLVLLLDTLVSGLPRRKFDRSLVFDLSKHFSKLTCNEDKNILKIKRKDGFEKRKLFVCCNCKLPLFYRPTDKKNEVSGELLYIFPDAVHEEKLSQSFEFREKMKKKTKPAELPKVEGKAQGYKRSTTTVSTAKEEEDQLEAEDVGSSFSLNAKIIAKKLGGSKRVNEEYTEAESAKRKKMGTLFQ